MDKFDENRQRTRYIRELNIFINKIASIINRDNLDKDQLEESIRKSKERLAKVPKVKIYSTHINSIEDSVAKILSLGELDFEDKKSAIRKECNFYEKSKRGKNYKKDKHKKSVFDE